MRSLNELTGRWAGPLRGTRRERVALGTYLLITAFLTGAVLLVDWRVDLGDQALLWLIVVLAVTSGLHEVLLRRARHGLSPG